MENILEFQMRKEQEYLNNLLDSINNLLNNEFEFSEDTKVQLEIEKKIILAKLSVWKTVERAVEELKNDIIFEK
ncbi:MAG: hypothetical protein ACLR4X_10750 [Clostridia bacterium]|nr:MAG TPA: hypothetical protein [Caudoviricetes sp.]